MLSFVGERIKALRQAKGMTQEELGALLGVGKSAIQKYEAGYYDLKASKIRKLCEIFHVMPRHFLFEDDAEFWMTIYGLPIDAERSFSTAYRLERIDHEPVNASISMETLSLLHTIQCLNDVGRAKANQLLQDFLQVPRYTRSEPEQ